MFKIRNSWFELLKPEFDKDYFKNLQAFLAEEYSTKEIFPPSELVFNAINYVAYDNAKVVIIGQDPYHTPGQAIGLSFAVPEGHTYQPSLRNIFKEIESDLGIKTLPSGDLSRWAKQGVLLLNRVLTVERGKAGSHYDKGWERVTEEIIRLLNAREKPMVFILWGTKAATIKEFITSSQHMILECPHPSVFSAHTGFFGCKHFSKTNQFLINHGMEPIDWK